MGNIATFGLYYSTQLLIGAFAGKKRPDTTRAADFGPSSIASQGAFVPLVIDRRRIGPVIAWVGDRAAYPVTVRVNTKGSKKKSKATGEINYVEAGWHLLCVGPASTLHKIYQNGKIIYTGPINSVTTPSGSSLTTTMGDTFDIYWGEVDQDVNATLGDASRVGIASRWPYTCYIHWTGKNLGPSPHWPLLEYDIETASQYIAIDSATITALDQGAIATLGASSSWNNPVAESVPSAGRYVDRPGLVLRCYRNPLSIYPEPEYIGPFEVIVDGVTVLSFSGTFRVSSAVAAPWTFRIISPTLWVIETAIPVDQVLPTNFTVTVNAFRVNATSGAMAVDGGLGIDGDIAAFLPSENSLLGIVGQILFSPFPHGLGLDESLVDVDSLVTASDALVAEGVTLSVIAKDGEEAMTTLGGIMADHGVVLYRAPATGLLTFGLVRQDTPAAVPEELVAGALPEIDVVHGDKLATRLIYEFPDVDREFRETTVTIDEDGAADRLSHTRARKVPLPTVIDAATAAIVSERRSQEEFGGAAAFRVRLNRGALELRPGQSVSIEGIDDVLRVTEVRPDGTSEVEVTAIPDHFGSSAATYATAAGGGATSTGTPVAADLQFTWIEVPAHLLEGGPPAILLLRVRAHDQIAYATAHLSADDTTYRALGAEFGIGTGGELLEGIAADDAWEIGTGPTLELLGPPDDDVIDDLTADETSWRLGRQMALIGEELFFLKKLVAVSGTTYRLDGLIRARYDTERAAHAIGAEVYLFQADEIAAFSDSLLTPGATLYLKSQPTAATSLSLASVTAVSKTLVGKGITPPRPCGLRVTAPVMGSASYRTGEDVTFKWASRIAFPVISGAGMQGAGLAVGAGVIGTSVFEIRVYDATDTLVRTETRSVPEWTYATADLTTDLAGETDFRVEVDEVNGGFYSDTVEISVSAL